MKKNIQLYLLLVPMIFVILLFVPAMLLDFVPEAYMQGPLDVVITIMLCVSLLIWVVLFYHIPIYVYMVLVIVYTVVSWKWILKQKMGNMKYAIVWLVLCVSSILMYGVWGWSYRVMANS